MITTYPRADFRLSEDTLTGVLTYDHSNQLLQLHYDDAESEVLSLNLMFYYFPAPDGHTWVKDWSEHSGLAAAIANHGYARVEQTASIGPFNSRAHLLAMLPHPGSTTDTTAEEEATA